MSSRLVLVADDDEDILTLVGLALSRAGVEFIEARDGATALAIAQERLPSLVLLDVSMPKLDGLEVTRRLRAQASTRDIPIILLTARAQSADVEEGFQAGATAYLSKPFSLAALIARVREFTEPGA
ncbi:response regulator [Capillimicrobium parvum]|uniref:Alkaline phosphatase synthesis transcriptional regulatory protein PhoP n=1 Tax=Capillimicrobium parvum TaxID=2884022 RepID=A0A9E6XUI2_9ACTN|nr:response regulator [Capillimicrobium parvum]UGS34742.1 Alkaline phosphatase synthesis transcriptional regulatory protein PhoP [Capillimicrobium parvum]